MAVRASEARYMDTGERFKVIDSWKKRITAHRQMPRAWTGSTKFLKCLEHGSCDAF